LSQPEAPEGCGNGIATAPFNSIRSRPEQAQLPFLPEGAEPPLLRCCCAVAAARKRLTGIATRDRGEIEGLVEALLVELEPAAERLARAAAPGTPLFAFDDTWRQAEEIGALSRMPLHDGQRLDRVTGPSAGAAGAVVVLQRGE
jgi:hypothetical protein